jgi:hypothetical protein
MFTSVVLRALKRELRDPPSDPPRDPAHIRLTIHEGMMCCALPSVVTREPMREAAMAFHPDGGNRNATRSTETVRVHIAAVICCIALVCLALSGVSEPFARLSAFGVKRTYPAVSSRSCPTRMTHLRDMDGLGFLQCTFAALPSLSPGILYCFDDLN